MINQISQTHPCSGKCKRFNGEQCSTCLIPEPESAPAHTFKIGDPVIAEYICELGYLVTTKGFIESIGDVFPNEVVINNGHPVIKTHCFISDIRADELAQRPDYLFDKEPTATEAIMEFMRFPGNAQPYCPACTKKDSDLRLLKVLHAENEYAFQAKIMVRNIIIVVLLVIVTVLAVALVGAL